MSFFLKGIPRHAEGLFAPGDNEVALHNVKYNKRQDCDLVSHLDSFRFI